MVLNPDVTVRSRGVIEKCSFCVQRIQEGKLTAKQDGRALRDSDVKTACQTACPTGAIVFGDGNDENGAVGKLMKDPMNYVMLEETNVRASVNYKMKVINRDESLDA
jgi:molybdopterin-containing oxidoreductase family iron-sulfur binding subunit